MLALGVIALLHMAREHINVGRPCLILSQWVALRICKFCDDRHGFESHETEKQLRVDNGSCSTPKTDSRLAPSSHKELSKKNYLKNIQLIPCVMTSVCFISFSFIFFVSLSCPLQMISEWNLFMTGNPPRYRVLTMPVARKIKKWNIIIKRGGPGTDTDASTIFSNAAVR